jgi:hypothetical protein
MPETDLRELIGTLRGLAAKATPGLRRCGCIEYLTGGPDNHYVYAIPEGRDMGITICERVRGLGDAHMIAALSPESLTVILDAAERSLSDRAKVVADVRTHLKCDCSTVYTDRGMTSPICPWHGYAIELLTEEEFAAPTPDGGDMPR